MSDNGCSSGGGTRAGGVKQRPCHWWQGASIIKPTRKAHNARRQRMAMATDLEHIFTGSAARLELNSTEQAVLAVVAVNRDQNGLCRLTRKEIGDLCNCAERTVSRAVAVLTAKNVVSREKEWSHDWGGLRIDSTTLEGNKPKPKKTRRDLIEERIKAKLKNNRQIAGNAHAALARMEAIRMHEYYSSGHTGRAERRRTEKTARKAARKKSKQ